MVVSDDFDLIKKVKFWATQARDDELYYQHSELGYNYRMSNILAAIGRGQLRVLDKLPSGTGMADAELERVIGVILGCFQ